MSADAARPDDDLEPLDPEESAAQIAALLSVLGPAPRDVLDVGCGAGRVLVPLRQAGHRVVGVEPSAAARSRCAAALATAGATATILDGAFPALPGRGTAFDAVLLLGHLLAEWWDPDDAVARLAAARARLRPGGMVVIDDLPGTLWPELASGGWQGGVSDDGRWQLAWSPDDAVFALRRGAEVDPRQETLRPGDRRLRLWTMGALRLAARLAGLSGPERVEGGNLLLLRGAADAATACSP